MAPEKRSEDPVAKNETDYSWTVMVYLAGDNNLTEESVFSLTEMRKVKTDDRIAVIAQLDPKSSNIPSHRYVINRRQPGRAQATGAPPDRMVAADAVAIEKPTVRFRRPAQGKARYAHATTSGGETDTGDPATLFNFISWSREHFPADHYMVILAGHGAGTEEHFLLKDENPTSSLSMPLLREVFRQVRKHLRIRIDILGMDVCLMSMVEVCYELRGLVDYLVGSESFSPTAGWPYLEILEKIDKELQRDRKAPTEALASIIVGEYIRFYSEYVVGGLSVDQSVLKVNAARGLARAVRKLATVMKGKLAKKSFSDALILSHWEAQSYNGELFVDLQDFCERLRERCVKVDNVATACNDVTKTIHGLVRKTCFTGVENQFSNGASIYFPWAEVEPSYRHLAFARAAHWIDFLQAYVEKTRRTPRGFKTGSEKLLGFGHKPSKVASAVAGLDGFRKTGDRKTGDRGVNPIHSMRNPPISVVREGLGQCVRANPAAVSALESFSKALR